MRAKLFCVIGLTLLGACRPPDLPVSNRPPVAAPDGLRTPLTAGKKFSIAAMDFGTPGSEEDMMSSALPGMLLTELEREGRFAIYEGGNIRHPDGHELIPEAEAGKFADGYLSGTITGRKVTAGGSGEVCVDVRLNNSQNHEVLFATSACLPFQASAFRAPDEKASGGAEKVTIEREGVARIAAELSRAIKQVSNRRVLAAEGRMITVDAGKTAGISRGMVAYLVATGERTNDAEVHRSVANYTGASPSEAPWVTAPVIVGEMYVVSVEDDHAVALLYRGDYGLPGDTVFFK